MAEPGRGGRGVRPSDGLADPGELAISAISIAELRFGVLVAADEARPARLSRLSAIQRRFDPLPVDELAADSYAQLAAQVVKAGRPRARVMDLLIAATAHAHGAAVYTRNADDLAGLDGARRRRRGVSHGANALPEAIFGRPSGWCSRTVADA